MSCAKCKPTVLPVCDALSEKLDVMFAAKALPNECGVSRVGWLEQLDRIIDIWRLIAVAVQNHVKTVPPIRRGCRRVPGQARHRQLLDSRHRRRRFVDESSPGCGRR